MFLTSFILTASIFSGPFAEIEKKIAAPITNCIKMSREEAVITAVALECRVKDEEGRQGLVTYYDHYPIEIMQLSKLQENEVEAPLRQFLALQLKGADESQIAEVLLFDRELIKQSKNKRVFVQDVVLDQLDRLFAEMHTRGISHPEEALLSLKLTITEESDGKVSEKVAALYSRK